MKVDLQSYRDALDTIIEFLMSHLKTRPSRPRSALRLDDVLRVRTPIEESGELRAVMLEASSRPLIPRRVREVAGALALGVDSATRTLETPAADVVIGSVSLASYRLSYTLDYPGLESGWEPGPPIIFLLSNYDEPVYSGWSPLVSSSNPAGRTYNRDYSVPQAEDEMRVSLENWALRASVGLLEELGGAEPYVLVDGPIYPAPRGLIDPSSPRWAREAWSVLISERVEAVELLESRGVPVIGVVKRVEKSSILSRTRGFPEAASSCIDSVAGSPDAAIISAIMSSCYEAYPGRVASTPLIRVEPLSGDMPGKLVQYVVIPHGVYQVSPALARIYRLELSERSLEIIQSMGLDPPTLLVQDTVVAGSLDPVSISLSDARAGSLASALHSALASAVLGSGYPVSYSTRRELEWMWESAA